LGIYAVGKGYKTARNRVGKGYEIVYNRVGKGYNQKLKGWNSNAEAKGVSSELPKSVH
jgi:hypothetical protein